MAKGSGGTRVVRPIKQRDWHKEAVELRTKGLAIAESLKGNPMSFHIDNGIKMDVEMSKTDLKTILSKATADNKFNAIKNQLAQDIPGFLRKAKYQGWREVIPGKHSETAYFAYYSRTLGAKAYLCVRKMKKGLFKPYAIINQSQFDAEIRHLRKDKPPE